MTRLLCTALLLLVSLASSAQPLGTPTVPVQSEPRLASADSLKTSAASNPTSATDGVPEVIITGKDNKGIMDSTVIQTAIDHYVETRLEGFQQSGLPRFIITGRERKFLLGIGGYVNFRTSYDFHGAIDNRDFITYDIPVPATEASRQRFGMDASSSRLFFKAIANSNTLGQVESYLEMDFRGAPGTLMRLRYAYISFWGLTFGHSVTSFCDLGASPTTVDAEGPNAYTFNFNDMVRYKYTSRDKRWTAVISAEAPAASLIPTDELQAMPQRLPDVPLYVQYAWGKDNHVRFSSILRELRYYDNVTDRSSGDFGWGLQLSGAGRVHKNLMVYAQGVYGQGIARYIQDIAGVGMDLLPDPRRTDRMEALPMGGWFGAVQYNYSTRVFLCAGYSQVVVRRPDYYPKDDTYHLGRYFFSNLFVNIGSSCTVGIEYINGLRRNMNDQSAHANRIQAMIQYNF